MTSPDPLAALVGKLLPCPFCTFGRRFFSTKFKPKAFRLECGGCGCTTAWFATEEETRAAWNRRATALDASRAGVWKYFAAPFRAEEAADTYYITDAKGQRVAVMLWPGHPPEETKEAEEETWALAQAFARAQAFVLSGSPVPEFVLRAIRRLVTNGEAAVSRAERAELSDWLSAAPGADAGERRDG